MRVLEPGYEGVLEPGYEGISAGGTRVLVPDMRVLVLVNHNELS